MVLDLEKYMFREGVTPLSGEELNARFYALVRRLHELEQLQVDWEAAVAEVRNQGVARVNEAVAPLVDGLRADMEALIAQGQAAQSDQAESVEAMLASMEAKIAEVDAALGGLGVSLDGVLEVSGQLTKDVVTVGGVPKLQLSVPPPAEVPPPDPVQLEYLLW